MKFEYACPECDSNDLRVQAFITAALLPDGAVDHSNLSDVDYDNDCLCICQTCDYENRVKYFEKQTKVFRTADR